ncbi:MAG: hypothetical protein ABJA34_08695 [Pseudonocardiales bacterium]
MSHVDKGDSSVWQRTRALLARREQRKWDSFSWLALRPLISSLNDGLSRLAPTMVGDLRRQWVQGQDPADPLIVDRTDSTTFLLLGDPGEQDASQYVVVPEVRQQAARADFMVICSDVIYPSGDVNDYVDGLYVPYAEVLHLPILALPGNHDWYDGLTGFMWHFCGADPLPGKAYGPGPGTPLRERPARLLWRRPSRRRAVLRLEDRRAARAAGGSWVPLQPGPYYAIETRHLLLVCIDTGIDGRIDHQQGEWLCRVSAHPKPKILLTGKPLVVNRQRHPCAVIGGPVRDPEGKGKRSFHSVAEVVAHGPHSYVACIGGDIHNFQHYRVEGMEHIVSGGGGAYMSATHPIPAAVQVPGSAPDVPPARQMFPTESQSLRHFARLLLPRVWRLVRALVAVLAGVTAACVGLAWGGGLGGLGTTLRWAPAGLAGGLCLRLLVVRATWTKSPAYRLAVVLAAFFGGVTIARVCGWLDPDHYLRHLVAWVGLTAAGGLLAWLMRRTGWWRPPHVQFRPGSRRDGGPWLPVVAAGFVALPVVVWLLVRDWWLTAAAAVTALTAIGGWLARWQSRPPRPRAAWKRLAPPIAYAVQCFDAAVVLDHLGVRHAPAVVLGASVGLAAVTLVAAAAVVLLCLLAPLRLARAWLVLPVMSAALYGAWLCWRGAAVVQRSAAVSALLVMGLLVAIFGIDALRRGLGRAYKPVTAVIVAVAAVGLKAAGGFGTWLPRAVEIACLVVVMTVLAVVTVNLAFLGAFSLLWDLPAHRPGDQFSAAEADWVIRWRAGGSRPPWRRVRRRANVVFPGADDPHGPIQSAVSEIFDSDEPPFIKNFLVVRTDPDEVTVTAHVVTGTDDVPPPYEVSIPLRRRA